MVRAGYVAGLLLLSSCDDLGIHEKLTDAQRDEITDIAADAADDQLGSRVTSLQERVNQLESDKASFETRIKRLEENSR